MSDALERNVQALLRAAALRPREAEARARFLGALSARPPAWPFAAAAAVLLAATLAAVLRRGEAPPSVADKGEKPSAREAAWIAVHPLGEDPTIALKARLPEAAARTKLLRIEGTADLPDRYRLFVTVHAEEERAAGLRLRPSAKLISGGYAPVARGRISLDAPWSSPAPILIEARLEEAHQDPETREAMKGRHPVRAWSFRAAGWDDALAGRLEPALDELAAAAGELTALVKEVEAACVSEERWRREAPRLRPSARALTARLEKSSPLKASTEPLFYAARNLSSDSEYFKWEEGKFLGPVTYHADQQKMRTFREEAWSFDALRRYAAEARELAARELALWIVKDVRRAGPRPEHAGLAKRPELAAYAERLRAGTELDALEAELRR